MEKSKHVCDIYGATESKTWTHQGNYCTCRRCSDDIQAFEIQPMKDNNLKMLLEVIFNKYGGFD